MKKLNKAVIMILLFGVIIFYSTNIFASNELSIDAKAGLIVETNTGKVIYDKDACDKNYPASVTKILTAIIVIENCNLDEKATVTKSAISSIPAGYIVVPLTEGEEIKVIELLYALMLKSANDAAYVLAEHVAGSIENFSDMMNKKAEEIGCKNSHFVNPNGIHNSNHYTTAYDMFLISNYAIKNETFLKIVGKDKYVLQATNKYPNKNRVMENTNGFINPNSKYYNEYVKGIKTGTTIQAGNCLITDVSKDGLNFINVVLGAKTSDSKFSETKKMIEYELENYELNTLHKKGDIIKEIEVKKATKQTKNLKIVISDNITVMNNKSSQEQLTPNITLNDDFTAPISKGQELGTIEYTVHDIKYSAKLIAENDVVRSYFVELIILGAIVMVVRKCSSY